MVYNLSVFLCLLFSAVFHLMYPVSKRVNDVLQRLDMAGISILIFGSTYGIVSYLLLCQPALYWTIILLALTTCTTSFVLTMLPVMHS